MANKKISQLNDGSPAQSTDQIPVNRAGANFRVNAGTVGSSAIQTATVTLSAAQLRTMGATPIQLVPAQGAGKVVNPIWVFTQTIFGTHPFQAATGTGIAVSYAGSGVAVAATIPGQVLSQLSNQVNGEPAILALYPQTDASNKALVITTTGGEFDLGPILTSVLNAGGLGYAPGDTGTIDKPPFAGDAHYVVDTVDGSGSVLTYHLVANGSGYGVTTGETTSDDTGLGTGFTVDINSVTQGDGTLIVTVYYTVVTLS